MSDVKITWRMIVDKAAFAPVGGTNPLKIGPFEGAFDVNVAGDAMEFVDIDIGTGAGGTNIPVPASITTLGLAIFANLSLNTIQWGRQVGGTFYGSGSVKAGEAFLTRLPMGTTALYGQAATATSRLRCIFLED